MESESGRIPVNAGQGEDNINPMASARSSDGHENISQQASEQSSSATSASSCTAKSSDESTQREKSLDGMYYYLERCKTCEILSVRIKLAYFDTNYSAFSFWIFSCLVRADI